MGPEGCASLVTAVPCKSGATFRSTITPRLGAQAFPDGSAVAHTSAAEGPGCAVPDELAPAWFLRRFVWYQP